MDFSSLDTENKYDVVQLADALNFLHYVIVYTSKLQSVEENKLMIIL